LKTDLTPVIHNLRDKPQHPVYMSIAKKNIWKIFRTVLQVICLVCVAGYIVWLYMERGVPPHFDRDSWTQRDGFTAISYSELTREPKPGLNSRQQFAVQVAALKQAGYHWITTDDIVQFYHNDAPLPEKALYLMLEGGRKDNVIFGQDTLGKESAHASIYTTTATLSSWSNFFITRSNVASLAKSQFWDVQSQGVGLKLINQHSKESSPDFFLTDYLRDADGKRKESDARMYERLQEYYKTSYDKLASLMPSPPTSFIMMPANSYNSYMPAAIKKANQELTRKYFKIAYTREGGAFNAASGSAYDLTRMQVPADFGPKELLDALTKWNSTRTTFMLSSPDDAQDWTAFWTQVEATPHELVLSPKEGSSDPALLRGSSLWENMDMFVTLSTKDTQPRFIYLRYTSSDSYLRITVLFNRLMVHERLPQQGLFLVYEKELSTAPPWNMHIRLKGNRLAVNVNGIPTDPSLLPVSAQLRKGAVGLGAAAKKNYCARFGNVRAQTIPTVWERVENGSELQSNDITAVMLPLSQAAAQSGATAHLLLRARSQGEMVVAAMPAGNLDFSVDLLNVPQFAATESTKLWDGVMVSPAADADWDAVNVALAAISKSRLLAVVQLSKAAATALANSGKRLLADRFVLDFDRADLSDAVWTPLAHRHNRNNFLYAEQKNVESTPILFSARSR